MSGGAAAPVVGAIHGPVDAVDGLPVWAFDEGDEMVPGHRAWERLGVGTRCETWLAWSVAMWSPVVVKLIRPHQVDHPRGQAAIAREAEALAAVRHPGFPRIWGDARHADVPHLVLEYVDGPDLDDVLAEEGARGSEDIVQLGIHIGSALRSLHTAGFAHLDLKPDNLAVRDARPVVLDLGSARRLGRTQPAGSPIGSAGYASPELEAGADISSAMDIYGLGVLLAEAALDERVFDSAGSPDRRPRVELPDQLDEEIRQLVAAMLAHEPSQRPSIEQVLVTLGRQVSGGDVPPWPAAATSHLRTP